MSEWAGLKLEGNEYHRMKKRCPTTWKDGNQVSSVFFHQQNSYIVHGEFSSFHSRQSVLSLWELYHFEGPYYVCKVCFELNPDFSTQAVLHVLLKVLEMFELLCMLLSLKTVIYRYLVVIAYVSAHFASCSLSFDDELWKRSPESDSLSVAFTRYHHPTATHVALYRSFCYLSSCQDLVPNWLWAWSVKLVAGPSDVMNIDEKAEADRVWRGMIVIAAVVCFTQFIMRSCWNRCRTQTQHTSGLTRFHFLMRQGKSQQNGLHTCYLMSLCN